MITVLFGGILLTQKHMCNTENEDLKSTLGTVLPGKIDCHNG